MRVPYRARQFLQALTARPGVQDHIQAKVHLAANLHPLFETMTRAEQAHGLRVLRRLLDQGQRDPDLLAAALLHDVGKTRAPLTVWERIVVVLARKLTPRLVRRMGQSEPLGLRKAFVVAERHPQWGADMLERAGGSLRLVRLVRYHQEAPPASMSTCERSLLRLLQIADAQS